MTTPTLPYTHTPTQPFDALAAEYDDGFTHTTIGWMMRQAVWRRLDARFRPGDHILELNCGTGEDAIYLAGQGMRVLATDTCRSMLKVARTEVGQNNLQHKIELEYLPIEEVTKKENALLRHTPSFDGVVSNFGGLNCVEDFPLLAEGLANLVRPGGFAVFCIMGPLVPWEWAWYLGHGKPGKAFRRLKRCGVEWRGIKVRYPSIHAVRRAFSPAFKLRRAAAIGVLLPPPYAEAWANRHPKLLSVVNRVERRLETVPPLPWLSDHYLIELERLP